MNTLLLMSNRQLTAADKTAIQAALNGIRSDLKFAEMVGCPSDVRMMGGRVEIRSENPAPFELVSLEAEPISRKAKMVLVDLQRQEQVAELYRIYPKKRARKAAYKAIEKALREVDFRRLLERTTAYAKAIALWPESQLVFVPNPASWFNAGCWDDDPATWIRHAPAPKAASVSPAMQQQLRQLREDLRRENQALAGNTKLFGPNHVTIPMIKKKIAKLEAEISKLQAGGAA